MAPKIGNSKLSPSPVLGKIRRVTVRVRGTVSRPGPSSGTTPASGLLAGDGADDELLGAVDELLVGTGLASWLELLLVSLLLEVAVAWLLEAGSLAGGVASVSVWLADEDELAAASVDELAVPVSHSNLVLTR